MSRFLAASAGALALVLILPGCQKAKEAASEKAAQVATEKMIESAIEKDGGKAKVSLGGDGVKATVTDEKGQTVTYEAGGSAKLTEADIDLPFYPGATVNDKESTRVVNGDTTMSAVTLTSPHAPSKVLEFYREKIKARSQGKQVMEMTEADGSGMLMLVQDDAATESSVQVSVKRRDDGSEVSLIVGSKKKGGQ